MRSTLCTGMQRSGSTWSYNVCRLLLEGAAGDLGLRLTAGFRDAERLERFLTAEADAATLFVIKTHTPGPEALARMAEAKVRNVCTFRDPRDCVASKMKFQSVEFEVAINVLKENLHYLFLYQSMSDVHFVRYEDMVADPRREIRRIAAYHQIALTDAALERVFRMTSPKAARRIVDGLHPGRPTAYWEGSCLVDRAYLFHRNHLQGGGTGRWKTDLSERQRVIATETFEDALERLGYESAPPSRNVRQSPVAARIAATRAHDRTGVAPPTA